MWREGLHNCGVCFVTPQGHEPWSFTAVPQGREPWSFTAISLKGHRSSRCVVSQETHASVDCIRFVRCGHTFCTGCASGYFESLMVDGAAGA